MKDFALEGSLAETPFARLLFNLWQRESSGRLRLGRDGGEKLLFFEKGQVLVEKGGISEPEFLEALVKRKLISAEQSKQCEERSSETGKSRIRTLAELGFLPPFPLWNLIESFFVRRLFRLFDRREGSFVFEPGLAPAAGERLGFIQTLDLILQGIRQMRDEALIEHHLPAESEPIYISTPYFLHLLSLEPQERYALDILSQSPNLRSFSERCELGIREGRKVLFALACMNILSVPEKTPKERPAQETPGAEPGKILDALNEKCAYIHKFITKQIGPLGQTIIDNCLEEIKPVLAPLFQKMKLQPDGRIEVDTALSATINHLPEDLLKTLIKGYNEILMAEVLAVKKSLGGVHESELVKSLEKIGCL